MDCLGLEKFIEEISALIRARYSLIYLETFEEVRALEVLRRVTDGRSAPLYVWSRTQGVLENNRVINDIKDPMAVLKWYSDLGGKSLLVLKDFHPYMKDPGIVRSLRDLSQLLKRSHKNIVLISPLLQVPAELVKEIAVVEVPLPGRKEVVALVDKANAVLSEETVLTEEAKEFLVDAASGLTHDEIENVLAKSIVSLGRLDRQMVQHEKRQIVKKSGLLEFLDIEGDRVPKIGGLDLLKGWLKNRRKGYLSVAREINLPLPKGILLVGIPGCGKSLTAMTVGREWQLPLLRLDLGKIFSGLVGSSEGNMRNAIATCEAVSPCVLWIDELEKGLSGTQSSGSSDGGTTSRVFGTLLTWMQEKSSPVFVVATANDISQLPPELLRKGRFDEIFFVDLPTDSERKEIFEIHMARFGWEAEGFDAVALAEKTPGFSGSEIEQTLVSARYLAFGNGESFSQEHILLATQETIPLSKTMGDRIDHLRRWASHRARFASIPDDQLQSDRFSGLNDGKEPVALAEG